MDLTPSLPEEVTLETPMVHGCWQEMMMGLSPAPYFTTKDMLIVEKEIRGDRKHKMNVFGWERVVLNLPGSKTYDPTRPWVFKMRTDGKIAADFFAYIDDERPTAPTEGEGWSAAKRICHVLCYLGLQDAARKRTNPSMSPGEWAGTMVNSEGGRVKVVVSKEEWVKGQVMIARIQKELRDRGSLDHETLERERGFLIYLSRTYRSMKPYLKGIHQTLDSWRKGRDREGWKLSKRELMAVIGDKGGEYDPIPDVDAPSRVKPVIRLDNDLKALRALFEGDEPKQIPIRLAKTGWVGYGLGDASGNGFGGVLQIGNTLNFQYGQWSSEISEKSSNYRELRNLVETLESLYLKGKLSNCEIFLLTDNIVADYAFYKGSSSSKHLFELILRLRILEMKGSLIIHLIHISGKRMIESGVDGLSRGDITKGVMRGEDILTFVPLNLGADERSPAVIEWVQSWWTGELPLHHMSPDDWYDKALDKGNYLWTPPPAAADAAIEQLCRNVHLHEGGCHIVLIPRLMTAMWRKQLGKVSDIIVTMPFDNIVWNSLEYEPLILSVILPFHSCAPWKLKTSKYVEGCERNLRKMWKNDFSVGRNLLRKLLDTTWSLEGLSESMVRKVL